MMIPMTSASVHHAIIKTIQLLVSSCLDARFASRLATFPCLLNGDVIKGHCEAFTFFCYYLGILLLCSIFEVLQDRHPRFEVKFPSRCLEWAGQTVSYSGSGSNVKTSDLLIVCL
jgi:hypothetical protein